MILDMLYSIPVPFDIDLHQKCIVNEPVFHIFENWFKRFIPRKWNLTKDKIYIIVIAQQMFKYNGTIPKWPFLWIFIGR